MTAFTVASTASVVAFFSLGFAVVAVAVVVAVAAAAGAAVPASPPVGAGFDSEAAVCPAFSPPLQATKAARANPRMSRCR
jgi:hypothetical protein